MSALDVVIVAAIVIGALAGWRMGLVQMAISIIGILIGFLLGAHLSGPIANLFTNDVGSASVAAVIAYVVVGAIIFVAAQLAGRVVTKVMRMMFLGWANRLAGALLGVLAGVIFGGIVIAIMARLAFPGAGEGTLAAAATGRVRERMRSALVESALAPAYLSVYKKVPARTLGMTPGAFRAALVALEEARQ